MHLLFSLGGEGSPLFPTHTAVNKNLLHDGSGKLNRPRSGNFSDL